MALRVSTTGQDVVLNDLGITVTHPTTNRDLSLEFTAIELRDSLQLADAIHLGNLTVDDGTFGIAAEDYDPDEFLLQELDTRGDVKYTSEEELNSTGTTPIASGIFPLVLNSTAEDTHNVYANGGKWITWNLEPGDLVTISGNDAAGDYTVEFVDDQQNFRVLEDIVDSTGGTVNIFHPAGATRIGVDSSNLDWSDSDNLQDVLEDLEIATSSGINEYEHRDLDQLVHILAEDSYEEITYSGIFATNITVWTDSGKTTKIREEQYTYLGSKPQTGIIIQYDPNGLEVERVTETYHYTGSRVTSIDRELT